MKNKYNLKVKYFTHKMDKKYMTGNRRRFLYFTRLIKWNLAPLVYLRVNEGYDIDNHDKKVMFYNDGNYDNKQEFNLALNAFLEGGDNL